MSKEEIIIQVPSIIANAYRNATEVERQKLDLKIASLIEMQLNNRRQETIERFRNTMNKASTEAQERGLTPEILTSILNDIE